MHRMNFPLIASLFLFSIGSSCLKRNGSFESSKTASLSVGKFKVQEGKPDWSLMEVTLKGSKGEPLKVEFENAEGAQNSQVSFKVRYDVYKISLTYYKRDHKTILYTECEVEKKKDHNINSPQYETPIQICEYGSEAPSGSVEIEPSSSVKIVPKDGTDAQNSSPAGADGMMAFSTTYYPYGNEEYPKTVCGDAKAYEEMYLSVTEKSRFWTGSCDNESWASCKNEDCLGKWSDMPDDVKKVVDGKKMVREPRCNIPCGKEIEIWNEKRSISAKARIYDACPSQHWNNRYKEKTTGKNPCAAGSNHFDLRKPLYLKINDGKESGNIKVLVDRLQN